jgi:hypothetical protein
LVCCWHGTGDEDLALHFEQIFGKIT